MSRRGYQNGISSSVIGPDAAGSGSGTRWSKLLPPADVPRELPAKSPPPAAFAASTEHPGTRRCRPACPIRACRRRLPHRQRRRRRQSEICPPVFTEQQIFAVQAAMIEHCERRRDRIALLDPPYAIASDDRLGIGAVRAWRRAIRLQIRRLLLSVAQGRGSVADRRFDPRATSPLRARRRISTPGRTARSAATRRPPTERSPGCRMSRSR